MKLAVVFLAGAALALIGADETYFSWEAKQAKTIVLASRVTGQIGKSLDFRITSTDRSYNFKLRATWLTPTVIQALARLGQIRNALSAEETRKQIAKALGAGDIVIQVEIDPREGSGIIPRDWTALLGPSGAAPSASARVVRGVDRSADLRGFPALAALQPRDYSYEIFWLVFPKNGDDGKPLFAPADQTAELSVRIQGKTGRVKWMIPEYLR